MAHFVGKSGADAIFKQHQQICKVLGRYHDKFLAAVEAARAAALITDEDAASIIALTAAADVYCAILKIVADNSGFRF